MGSKYLFELLEGDLPTNFGKGIHDVLGRDFLSTVYIKILEDSFDSIVREMVFVVKGRTDEISILDLLAVRLKCNSFDNLLRQFGCNIGDIGFLKSALDLVGLQESILIPVKLCVFIIQRLSVLLIDVSHQHPNGHLMQDGGWIVVKKLYYYISFSNLGGRILILNH